MSCHQKNPIEGAETDKNLTVINKKILELKKKIQLSEGQKKAYSEELELESKNNTKKIANLKKEIKVLVRELSSAKVELGGERQFRLVKYLHELGPVANKDYEQLKDVLDLRVIDLHKQLDVFRYKRKKRKSELEKLETEYQKYSAERSGFSLVRRKSGDKPSRKTLSHLENEIHRFSVQWMEAEHIRKKYSGIRYSLLNDSVKFESALKKVEDMIKQQNDEISQLQEVNKSAMHMRDSTMSALLQEEQRISRAAAEREAGLSIARKKLADRRGELDRLERRIFPQARPTLIQQDSIGSDLAPVEEENYSMVDGYNMDEIFQKLMKATGVSDQEHVFERFKGQRSTTERLIYLKNTTENEKKQLESEQNVILSELETYKFAQVKDKEENLEEMENLKKEIQEEIDKMEKYEGELKQIRDVLLDIKRSFYDCCLKLEDSDNSLVPDWSDDTSNLQDIFELLKQKYLAASLMVQEVILEPEVSPLPEKKESENPPLEKVISEDRAGFPAAYRELLAPRTKSRGTGTPSGAKPTASDEEEEIPSRGFLKRQAQLIVDTKSRRKGYRPPARS